MRAFRSVALVLGLMISAVSMDFAATVYYVDNEAGSDTNNGRSQLTPFNHCPGDSNAVANALMTPAPGDTIVFKRGVVYRGSIRIASSGTSAALVTYTTGDWGTGMAVIDASGAVFAVNLASASYVAFQGLEIRGATGDASAQWGIGTNGVSVGVEISNCTVHGNRNNNVRLAQAVSCKIHNNVLYDMIVGVHGGAGSQLYLYSRATSESQANEIYQNTVYNGEVDAMTIHGDFVSIHHNRVTDHFNKTYHGDGIVVNGDPSGDKDSSDISIYGNIVSNCGSCIYLDAATVDRTVRRIRIYNNCVFESDDFRTVKSPDNHCTAIEIAHGNGGTVEDVWIYNNSVYNTRDSVVLGGFNGARIYIKNNIMCNARSTSDATFNWVAAGTKTGVVLDHNLYYALSVQHVTYEGTAISFADLKAKGQEAHGVFGDPAYLAPPAKMQLALGSPCIDAGTDDLAAVFATDIDLSARPAGRWDIGAYEYGGATGSDAPKNLRIKGQ